MLKKVLTLIFKSLTINNVINKRKEVKKMIRKYYNVRENEKTTYDKLYNIEMTETRMSRTKSGKSWSKRNIEETKKIIDFEEYFNYLSSVQYFKNIGGIERVEKSYTISGYIPTRLTSVSPDRQIKVVRHFRITRKEY